MDRNNLVSPDLKPVVFSKSPIINNSASDTDSSIDTHKNVKSHSEVTRSKHRRSSSHKKPKHHKSKRSQSRDHHNSKSRRSRSKDHCKRYKSSGSHKKRRDSLSSDKRKHSSKGRSRSPKFDRSLKKSHRDDRKKKYKDSSPKVNRHNDDNSKAIDETSGVKFPSYLNSATVNSTKHTEIDQKRKLLWSKKDDSKKLNIEAWNASSVIASRGDDKKAAKFRKLMGIHDEPNTQSTIDLSKKENEQTVLFNRLDADYQSARSHTHTSRGVGLGYNQSAFIDPHAYLAGRRDDN